MALCILFAIHFAVMGLLLWIKCIKHCVPRLALSLTPHSRNRLKQGKCIFVRSAFRSQICLASLITWTLFVPVVENLNFNEDIHKLGSRTSVYNDPSGFLCVEFLDLGCHSYNQIWSNIEAFSSHLSKTWILFISATNCFSILKIKD